jgi:hypothetical protein
MEQDPATTAANVQFVGRDAQAWCQAVKIHDGYWLATHDTKFDPQKNSVQQVCHQLYERGSISWTVRETPNGTHGPPLCAWLNQRAAEQG